MRRGSNEHDKHHHYYPDRFLGGGYCKGMGGFMNEKQRVAFEAWYDSYDMRTPQDPFDRWLARKAWQAALESPQVQDLKDALQDILVDMEVEGNGTGYEYQNAQAVLAAMEKQK